MKQIQPETGEYLPIFQNNNTIIFFMFLFLYSFTECIKEGIKCNLLENQVKRCWIRTQLQPETWKYLANFSEHRKNDICFLY